MTVLVSRLKGSEPVAGSLEGKGGNRDASGGDVCNVKREVRGIGSTPSLWTAMDSSETELRVESRPIVDASFKTRLPDGELVNGDAAASRDVENPWAGLDVEAGDMPPGNGCVGFTGAEPYEPTEPVLTCTVWLE